MYNPYTFNPSTNKLPWIQYQSNTPYEFAVTERSSQEYKKFIEKIERNFSCTNKQSACLLCWAFISPLQKKRHAEHEPFMITASLFKNEESFIQLATQHGKISGNKQSVIVFKDTCQFQGQPAYNPTGGTQTFSGG